MKTDRERLEDIICERLQDDICIPHCNHGKCSSVKSFADYLISRGVTIPVRCSECRYFDIDDWDGETLYGCEFGGVEFDVNPDTYCCYGERKEE